MFVKPSKFFKQWNVSQTKLLHYAVSKMSKRWALDTDHFQTHHWEHISAVYFNNLCSATQCHKRWIFAMGLDGVKHRWSQA